MVKLATKQMEKPVKKAMEKKAMEKPVEKAMKKKAILKAQLKQMISLKQTVVHSNMIVIDRELWVRHHWKDIMYSSTLVLVNSG